MPVEPAARHADRPAQIRMANYEQLEGLHGPVGNAIPTLLLMSFEAVADGKPVPVDKILPGRKLPVPADWFTGRSAFRSERLWSGVRRGITGRYSTTDSPGNRERESSEDGSAEKPSDQVARGGARRSPARVLSPSQVPRSAPLDAKRLPTFGPEWIVVPPASRTTSTSMPGRLPELVPHVADGKKIWNLKKGDGLYPAVVGEQVLVIGEKIAAEPEPQGRNRTLGARSAGTAVRPRGHAGRYVSAYPVSGPKASRG